MYSSESYSDSIKLLNSLQSNAANIEEIRKFRKDADLSSIPTMLANFNQIGYKPVDFDKLNIIHISGTKGKGSTCAYTERLLRELNYINAAGNSSGSSKIIQAPDRQIKTGLFTSPHMIEVRERIRINGKPISKNMFAKYFFQVWNKLNQDSQPNEPTAANSISIGNSSHIDGDNGRVSGKKLNLPSYFRFLTLLAFHVFIQENVNAAIIEVGIGGEYDSTNIINSPIVCGITSIGIDHIQILGSTVEEIAWHKAGIMKPKSMAYSSSGQTEQVLQVFKTRAAERNCTLYISGAVLDSDFDANFKAGIEGKHQLLNASLAMDLAYEWIKKTKFAPGTETGIKTGLGLDLSLTVPISTMPKLWPSWAFKALSDTKWPGRSHHFTTPQQPNIHWYLDGAHTPDSIKLFTDWFLSSTESYSSVPCVLIFSQASGRDKMSLIKALQKLVERYSLDDIIFCNKITSRADSMNNNIDQTGFSRELDELQECWDKAFRNSSSNPASSSIHKFHTITEAVEYVNNKYKSSGKRVNVVVTGSLHLVGGVLDVTNTLVE